MYKGYRINQIYDTEISDEIGASYRCKIIITIFFISMRSLSYKDKKVTVDNNWIIGYSFNNISSMVRFHKSKHANVRSVSTHTL